MRFIKQLRVRYCRYSRLEESRSNPVIILAGFSAPLIAVLFSKRLISRNGIIIWNLLCLGLLVNIVAIAILSTPSPWRIFMNEPANNVVTYFPISWLPGFLVPLAYYLHFLSIRQMMNIRGR